MFFGNTLFYILGSLLNRLAQVEFIQIWRLISVIKSFFLKCSRKLVLYVIYISSCCLYLMDRKLNFEHTKLMVVCSYSMLVADRYHIHSFPWPLMELNYRNNKIISGFSMIIIRNICCSGDLFSSQVVSSIRFLHMRNLSNKMLVRPDS